MFRNLNKNLSLKVCSKDGPPLSVDKQLCWPFQPWTLLGLSHICCPGVFNISIINFTTLHKPMNPLTS